MKYLKFTFVLFFISFSVLNAQNAPAIQWQKIMGGLGTSSLNELCHDIQQTSDGGYILAGTENDTPLTTTGNFSVIKLNSVGDIQWQKSLGGNLTDRAYSVRPTTDGGYIVVGETASNDGDVTGNHGGIDYWVVKLNASGNIEWQKTFGGNSTDIARSVRQTSDGGYIIAGETSSTNGDVTYNHGPYDYWVIKTDSSGNIQWEKTYGGSADDRAYEIQQTTDNGYVIAGYSFSNNGDVSGNHGFTDYWIVKLTPTGDLQWQKALGGTAADRAYAISQSADGGYFVAGMTTSSNGDVSLNYGFTDYWIVKITAMGDIQWQKSFGTNFKEDAYGIDATADGGCIVTGEKYSISQEGSTSGAALPDYWVIKLNAAGIVEWQETYGGSFSDISTCIKQTSDGGYIIGGHSHTGNNNGFDFWVIKLAGDQLNTNENHTKTIISIYPNPAKDFINIENLPHQATISIIDISGRKISSKKYSEKNISINTSGLINGNYIIQVEHQGTAILSKKIIISK